MRLWPRRCGADLLSSIDSTRCCSLTSCNMVSFRRGRGVTFLASTIVLARPISDLRQYLCRSRSSRIWEARPSRSGLLSNRAFSLSCQQRLEGPNGTRSDSSERCNTYRIFRYPPVRVTVEPIDSACTLGIDLR